MSALMRMLGLGAVAVAAAGLVSTAAGGGPQGPILEPVGGGVRIVYTLGGLSVRCSYGRVDGQPRLACGMGRAGGGGPRQALAAVMDAGQVVFLRVRAGVQTRLAVLSQRAGPPVYGPFQQQPKTKVVRLLEGQTLGFLGTNIACTTERYGNAPAMRCLARGPGGLPGPCCGPNFPLLVKSKGFFLTPHRLQGLLVVSSGVREATSGSEYGPPPYRVIRNWYL